MADPAGTIVSRDPTRPEVEVGRFTQASDTAIAAALDGAAAAVTVWRDTPALRAASLDAFAAKLVEAREELADLLAREVGKPLAEARGEVDRSAAILRFYAQAAWDPIGELLGATSGPGSRLEVRRSPVGIVLAITPWNFPLAIPLWKAGPALAWGNAVVLKPSRQAVATAMRLDSIAATCLPAGVFQVVLGNASQTARMIAEPRVGAVSFTGSVMTGRRLAMLAAEHQTPIQCEMGGQNAAIVLDDADLDAAAAIVTGAAMAYAGQKCTATRRVVVLDGAHDAFLERLTASVRGLAVGDPLDAATVVGPVIDADARSTIEGAVHDAIDGGSARLLAAGTRPDPGWFCAPTVLEVGDPAASIAQEEVFGPVLSVLRARDDGEAVRIANGTRFGLSAAVYGTDLDRAARVARELEAGLVRVNAPTTGVDFHAPFGGLGESSYGVREQGRAARELFTKTQTVTIVPPPTR